MTSEETVRDASSRSNPGETFYPPKPTVNFKSNSEGEGISSPFSSKRIEWTDHVPKMNTKTGSTGHPTGTNAMSDIVSTESISSGGSASFDVVMGTIKFIGEEKWGILHKPQSRSPRSSAASSGVEGLSPSYLASSETNDERERNRLVSAGISSLHTNSSVTTSTPDHHTHNITSGPSTSSPSSTSSVHSSSSLSNSPHFQLLKSAADCLHAQDFSRMLETLRSAPDDLAAVWFGRGIACYKLRRYPTAHAHFTKMLQVINGVGSSDHASKYLAQYYLGEIAFSKKQFTEAADLFGKAAKSHKTDTVAKVYRMVPPSLASVYSKQGAALRQGQRILEAVQSYKSALHHITTSRDKLAVHTSLGNLYQGLGENKRALEQYEHTVKLSEELGDFVSLGWAHGNLGNSYLGLHDKDKAIKHLNTSLELALKHEPTPQAIGRAYNNLGTAHQSCGNMEEAEEYYGLALSQAIYGSDRPGEARVRGNYGNLLMLKKDYDPAIDHYSETLALTTDRSTKSTALHNRGCAYYEKAESEKKKKMSKPDGDKFIVTFSGPVARKEELDIKPTRQMRENYEKGAADLWQVVGFHEETFQTMRGSQHGLNLSVSLFETNSRTFHRLQDCHYSLLEWDRALESAEQSRARTLGELLLDRKYGQLALEVVSPLRVDKMEQIVKLPGQIIVYVSYTGARLLVWVFVPLNDGQVITNRFQVALEDDQFDDHSLDYFLRYILSESLNEKDVDMYTQCKYEKSVLSKLYNLLATPLLTILERIEDVQPSASVRDIIFIPDSYTNLMPMFALFSSEGRFLGDKFNLRYMPSLLTLGILSQLPPVVVSVPTDSSTFCIAGNPTIPTFKYEGDTWNLGKLPFATQEAESVAHILNCRPIMHEEATKNLVVSMLKNSKVVHLATHGSASAGFLAFAGSGSTLGGAVTSAKSVLLYPEEVEKMSISPALVVLSSCDSGRGAVKADGIQGMARAFILAGAQAVLTTLWRVPDESAAVFMKFFYQYLMDGFRASQALRKAMLSIRSFSRYSNYIHWSGYQLTGRELEFQVAPPTHNMGPSPVFPRLDILNKLEKALVKDRFVPTDVQIVSGLPGLRPLEPVLQFVSRNHSHFPGGVFFVSAHNEDFQRAAVAAITKKLSGGSHGDAHRHGDILLILDSLHSLPPTQSLLHELMASNTSHVIITMETRYYDADSLKRKIEQELIRGVSEMTLEPLTELHVLQRLVHGIMLKSEFTPYNKEQDILSCVAGKCLGSPDLVDVMSALLGRYIDEAEENNSTDSFLDTFKTDICSVVCSRSCSVSYGSNTSFEEDKVDDISIENLPDQGDKLEQCRVFEGDFISHLIDNFQFTRPEFLMLVCISLFDGAPLPFMLLQQIQSLLQDACPGESQSPVDTLLSASLLHHHPAPVITHTQSPPSLLVHSSPFYHVPLVISRTVCDNVSNEDLVMALSVVCSSLQKLTNSVSSDDTVKYCLSGLLHSILKEAQRVEDAYKTLYRMYLTFNN